MSAFDEQPDPLSDALEECGRLNKRIKILETLLANEQVKRVTEYAEATSLVWWIQDSQRGPSLAAFANGPERMVAHAVEEALKRAKP